MTPCVNHGLPTSVAAIQFFLHPLPYGSLAVHTTIDTDRHRKMIHPAGVDRSLVLVRGIVGHSSPRGTRIGAAFSSPIVVRQRERGLSGVIVSRRFVKRHRTSINELKLDQVGFPKTDRDIRLHPVWLETHAFIAVEEVIGSLPLQRPPRLRIGIATQHVRLPRNVRDTKNVRDGILESPLAPHPFVDGNDEVALLLGERILR